MLFNSSHFIFAFLPITFILYFLINHRLSHEYSKLALVACSLFFYAWWNILYLPIIIGSIFFNYYIGGILSNANQQANKKRRVLKIGIVCNLLLLGYFKYTDFLIENVNWMADTDFSLLELTLPLAISFFTFQQIAYLVDSYKGETKEYDLLNYSLFVTFFPQLIAGPIVHHKEMMPQFTASKNKQINFHNIAIGLIIFSIGLFKKVAIADTFAVWANQGFDAAEYLSFYSAWATSLSYTFQLYFDFSGYSDMAIGLALMFNIKLPINFNSPYKALSIQDFWRRWHMTLSRFLRDYIYIPLGGNRVSKFRTYVNLMLTFIIGGIWHGAGWTFIVWGFLHGLALVIHRLWNKLGLRMWTWVAWLVTFNFVNITWVVFRAKEWDDGIKVLKGMFGMAENDEFKLSIYFLDTLSMWLNYPFYQLIPYINSKAQVNEIAIVYGFFALLLVVMLPNTNIHRERTQVRYSLMFFAAILLAFSVIQSQLSSSEVFLYFNF